MNSEEKTATKVYRKFFADMLSVIPKTVEK